MNFSELMDCFFISEEDNNQVAYNELLEAFKKHNITPIIGAGLSCWAYPLWSKMLQEQAKNYGIESEINELLNENKYEEAASKLEEQVKRHGFLRLLQRIFNISLIEKNKANRPNYLKKIPTLFRGPIITTNFDRVIEHLFEICQTRVPDMVIPSDDFQSDKIRTALQQNSPILVKIHGDIEDPSHLVLTKESYDSTYGGDSDNPNFELPMPKFLKAVLERNPVLFLGCSLHADRTCTIVQACAQGVQQFAFLELPKETENKNDPLHPNLKKENGKFLESFQERYNRIIGDLNIIPVWYPYGMHEEALNAFIAKLCADLDGDTPSCNPAGSVNDIKYYPLHKLLGRDGVVKEIAKILSEDEIYCVWVEGAAGIGKTETCKAVHSVLINKFSSLSMPYIDLTGITSLSGFFTSVAKGVNAQIPGSISVDNVPEYLLSCVIRFFSDESSDHFPRIIYFDNWEDIWYGLNGFDEKDILVQWMMKLHLSRIHTLISSREMTQAIPNNRSFHIDPLDNAIRDKSGLPKDEFDRLDSVRLFMNILGRGILPSEYQDFQTLICNLEGHPLSIVLTATQARSEINIGDVLNHWERAKQDTASINKKHSNLEIALQMSWNTISINRSAVIQWGLEYYSLGEIPEFIFRDLRGDSSEKEWDESLQILLGANLVYVTPNRDAVAMLLPLKKQFSVLNKDHAIDEICLVRWAEYMKKILNAANDWQSNEYLNMHYTVIDLIPQIFFVIEQLLSFESEQLYEDLNTIVLGLGNYYKFYIQSEDILKKLIPFYEKKEDSYIFATVLLEYGDLLKRFEDLDGAKEAYSRAESLYRKEQDDLGWANALQSCGDLLRRLGDIDGAKEAYDKAESLYRKVRNDLGLANVLRSRGDLLNRLGDVDGAKEAYDRAESLYRKVRNDLGLANVLQSRGDLLNRLGDMDGAREAYDRAEELYRKERDDLGLANVLQSRGELLSCLDEVDGAQEAYGRAESLYRKERSDLGLANVLQARGNLLNRLGDVDGAKEAYDRAESLYRKERDDLGLANVLRSRGDLLNRLGDVDGAQELYDRAESLYRKERDDLGLANVLQSRGDLLSCLDEVDGARELYDRAESLYIKERSQLGLANVQKARERLR